MGDTGTGRLFIAGCIAVALLLAGGCSRAYYKTMEGFGVHKRDLLVSRVEEARDSQDDAREQFQTALEAFSSVAGFQGGELKQKYEELNREYERSEKKAEAVRTRIEDVEDVSRALFQEWEKELEEYSNSELRADSERRLSETRVRYGRLIGAMHRAEDRIAPVLSAFKDQVLYLKHNLNAQAIASLQDELGSVESDVATLIREMEQSIAEADMFIQEMLGQ